MQKLIDTLNDDNDAIPVRWLNAMLGRIFLGICKTAALEAVSGACSRAIVVQLPRLINVITSLDRRQFIVNKVMKKIKKIKTPSFLGDIVVKEIDVGTTPP